MEEIRELTPEEVAAFFLFSSEYAGQNKGAIEYYKSLSRSDKDYCIVFVAKE